MEAIDVLEGFILDGNSAASHWPVSLALLVAHIPSDSNSSVVTSQSSQDVLGLEWNSSSLDLKISGGLRETDSVEGLASKDVRNTISKTSDGGLSAGEGSSRVHIIRADGNLVHQVVVEIVEVGVAVRELLIVTDPVSSNGSATVGETRVALNSESLTSS